MIVGIVIIRGGGGSGGTNRLMMAQQYEEKVQQCYNVIRIFSVRQHVWIFFLYFFILWLAYIFPRRYGRIDDDDDDGCVLKSGQMRKGKMKFLFYIRWKCLLLLTSFNKNLCENFRFFFCFVVGTLIEIHHVIFLSIHKI